MKNLKLSDAAIGQIVQLLQMGILTGTDISDQFRTLRLDLDQNQQLVPTEDFTAMMNENLERFAAMAEEETDND